MSVVVPVYRGAETLRPLVEEIATYFEESATPAGRLFCVTEVILVHDCGPDASDVVIRELADSWDRVTPVWLSRNFGQHAATIAGIASSAGAWVATLDEDGQHDPAALGLMIDVAVESKSELVYGVAVGGPDHAAWRRASSAVAHKLARLLTQSSLSDFSSFRLVLGTPARSIAAYCGPRTYLDVALGWAVRETKAVSVPSRTEWRSESGYRLRSLLTHFWTLVLSSGTRPLRAVAAIGAFAAVAGVTFAIVVAVKRATGGISVPGWASTSAAVAVSGGLVLLCLGIIAEYVGQLLKIAQGRPLYVIVDDVADGPLGARD